MKRKLFIALFFSFIAAAAYSQQQTTTINGYMVPVCVYKGDTIPAVQLPNVYIFRPLKFKNEKERREYYRLVRNVKKTLPLAREINRAVIETYEYIETLPDKKAREKHLKLVKAFMGPFKAGFYQTFAALFGASLKKEYHPEGEDRLTERVVLLVENGQI